MCFLDCFISANGIICSTFAISAAIFVGCKKDDPAASEETTSYNVRMTDAPGNYQEVNINVIGAEVHSDEKGWVGLNVVPGIYNLLDLTNGKDTLIANGIIAIGTVSQIRLILGDSNTIKVDDRIYPLSTPSAEQSGLKLQVHSALVKDVPYTLILDFDAAMSIVETGSHTYKLKPVIRTVVAPYNGGIKGIVLPISSQPAIYAILGTDTFGAFVSTTTGEFMVQGLVAGNYKVMIVPIAPFADTTFANVSVSAEVIFNMGTVIVH